MFTGIVSETGRVTAARPMENGREFEISCPFAGETHVDESISVNGVCLTVTEVSGDRFHVQCVRETLEKTTCSELDVGDIVNLERSLNLQQALEGHLVQGHVDTTGRIERIVQEGTDRLLEIRYPEEHAPYVVGRGSIAVDGISLTVAQDEKDHFTVAIIPYTWEHTNLHLRKEGDRVNLEFDIFGKYVVKYLARRFGGEDAGSSA